MDIREKLSRIRLEPHEKAETRSRLGPGRRIALALAVVLVVVVAVAVLLGRGRGGEVAATATNGGAAAVAAPVASEAGSAPRTLAAGGYVEARRTALVWPGRDGIVAAVHVARGQRVKQGDLLLELDARAANAAVDMARAELEEARARLRRLEEGARPEELSAAQAELSEAEAQLADARAEHHRLVPLADGDLVSPAEVERAQHRVEAAAARVESLRANRELLEVGAHPAEIAASRAAVARGEAALRKAETDLDLTRLRAPFDGTVIAVELESGEVVSLFDVGSGIEVADESELWVRVDVPEDRIGGLRLGDRARVVAQAVGSRPLSARVVEIAPKADRQSNTVEVAVALDDPPPMLRPDMSARVDIELSGGDE